jgi:hypothetical protein
MPRAQGALTQASQKTGLTEARRTVAMEIRRALDGGYRKVEVAPEAQENWRLTLLSAVLSTLLAANPPIRA